MRDVVHVEARERQRPHVVPARRLLTAELRVARLKRPGDEGAEAARLVLQAPHLLHVLDALRHRLAEADDHRRRALHADGMRAFHDMQPVVRHDLLGADLAAHLVNEDLRAAARQAVEARRLQPLERLEDGEPRLAREVLDLCRRERMDGDRRIRLLDQAQHLLVIREAELRVEPALDHDLRAAGLDRLPDLLENLFMGE